jgi:hypothetical protein
VVAIVRKRGPAILDDPSARGRSRELEEELIPVRSIANMAP